jgi:hypothetical protein
MSGAIEWSADLMAPKAYETGKSADQCTNGSLQLCPSLVLYNQSELANLLFVSQDSSQDFTRW